MGNSSTKPEYGPNPVWRCDNKKCLAEGRQLNDGRKDDGVIYKPAPCEHCARDPKTIHGDLYCYWDGCPEKSCKNAEYWAARGENK